MVQSTYGGKAGPFSDLGNRPNEKLGRAADRAEGLANRVAGQGREAGEGMQGVAGNFKSALDRSIRDQPMATVATATIVGFVLGALWKA